MNILVEIFITWQTQSIHTHIHKENVQFCQTTRRKLVLPEMSVGYKFRLRQDTPRKDNTDLNLWHKFQQ